MGGGWGKSGGKEYGKRYGGRREDMYLRMEKSKKEWEGEGEWQNGAEIRKARFSKNQVISVCVWGGVRGECTVSHANSL